MSAEPVTAMPQFGWLAANQRFLAAELARIGALLDRTSGVAGADEALARAQVELQEARPGIDEPAIDRVAELFGLTAFERDVLLLVAGVELDASLGQRCTALTGGAWASFGLALAALPEAHWSALLPDAPLRAFELVRPAAGDSLVAAPLTISEIVVHALAGLEAIDPALAPFLTQVTPAPIAAPAHLRVVEQLVSRASGQPAPRLQLTGDDPDGQSDVAVRAMRRLGRRLWRMRASDVPRDVAGRQAFAAAWNRDAALTGGSLLIAGVDDDPAAADLGDRVAGLLLVSARHPVRMRAETARFVVDLPEPLEQRRLWQDALDPGAATEGMLDLLSSQFVLSSAAIWEVAQRLDAVDRGGSSLAAALAIRPAGVADGLGELAAWIEPRATWERLILPPDQTRLLREIVDQVRGRTTVHESWGFRSRSADGLGIAVLFEGDSGTGKSLAAEVIAAELGLAVLRVDLASVVSKYIGETEKNIARVFAAAEGTGAVILFNEAEALFGKRSEVRDSHDRYANIEVAYLLQRIESYRGLAILTSNAKSSIDRAFLRRLRFVVRFPFPDPEQRERIWRAVFPASMPAARLDFGRLANLNLAGGDIRNIAIGAAFLAAAAGEAVTMGHLRDATRRELEKLGRPAADIDTRGWL
jgi:hypothetical protein